MKFRVVREKTASGAHSPIYVIEQETGQGVGWINRYLDREYVHRLANTSLYSYLSRQSRETRVHGAHLCRAHRRPRPAPQLIDRHQHAERQITQRIGSLQLAQQPGAHTQAEIGRLNVFVGHQAIEVADPQVGDLGSAQSAAEGQDHRHLV